MLPSGYFSCNVHLGFYVKGGEIQGRVKDVMISGNTYQALFNLKEISRDSRWIGVESCFPTFSRANRSQQVVIK